MLNLWNQIRYQEMFIQIFNVILCFKKFISYPLKCLIAHSFLHEPVNLDLRVAVLNYMQFLAQMFLKSVINSAIPCSKSAIFSKYIRIRLTRE